MKKMLVICMVAIVTLLVACKANYPVAQQSGKEDIAYLLFVSDGTYKGKQVEVKLDGDTHFTATVVKLKTSNRKGSQYGVATGKRDISVTYQGQVIYSKQLFLSSQQTKIITLP